ncbi:methyltransferase domain-containing protein [Actinomadura macra]|uniref:methyltransferase domain-containing protein n=1 Tax=Actinomadura macra TaxID=46164 RepID=UPI0008333AE3|nr:methyltransferase domain-containing protein [Actinomadura macra]
MGTRTGTHTGAARRYVHGYSEDETRRLGDQADTLAALLHDGTAYPPGSRVLEAGCGVGAQTVHLAASSPGADVVAVDVSAASLARAHARLTALSPVPAAGGLSAGAGRVEFVRADLHALPFADAEFDHVFVCFVLEHLPDPAAALAAVRRVLRPGGTITVIEGDHGSAFFHPDSAAARAAIGHLVRLQGAAGGDALLGRRLQPLLSAAGFERVEVRPRTVYADRTRPTLMEGFTRATFIAMVAAVRDAAVAAGLTDPGSFDRGIADLEATAREGGTFHYTFVKGVAVNP